MMPSEGQIKSLPPEVAATCLELYRKGQADQTTFRMLASFVRLRTELGAKYPPTKAESLAAALIYGNSEQGNALLKAISLNRAPAITRATT
jgi:hypothetical protein